MLNELDMSRSTKRLLIILLILIVVLGVSKYLRTAKNVQLLPPQNQKVFSTAPATAPESPNAECHMNGQLPDANCTPGAVNPNVTQDNISQTICIEGYTKTIRPTSTYTNQLKQQQMKAYGFNDSIKMHEEDHLISLELGGSPDDPKNLWPEPGASPNPKDKVENFLHSAICAGKIQLQDAQTRISKDWTKAEQGL